MANLDNAINGINAAADRANETTDFYDNVLTGDELTNYVNPNNSISTPTIAKQIKEKVTADTYVSQAIKNAGWDVVGDFSTLPQVNDINDVLSSKSVTGHEDALWRTNQSLPYTPTGTDPTQAPELGKWVAVAQGELKSIARSLNVADSEVIYSTDTVTVLDNVPYIYDASTQTTWGKPAGVGAGETITDVTGSALTTTGGSYTLTHVSTANSEISIKGFGITGDGDETATMQSIVDFAVQSNVNINVDIDVTVTDLTIARYSLDNYWKISGSGTITATSSINLTGLARVSLEGITLSAPSIYVQGFRYSNMRDVVLDGQIYWGRWDVGGTPGGASWSTYWSHFDNVAFGSIYTQTSITDANFNSNTFTNCEFRDTQAQGALWKMKNYAARNDEVFVSNTFVGCDFSYADVWWLETDFGNKFSVTVVGGYLDTGTNWYRAGGFKGYNVDVHGLRNPSGITLDDEIQSDLQMTTGAARPHQQMPISAVSILDSHPKSALGSGIQTITATIPATGKYTLAATIHKAPGADGAAWKYENNTTLEEAFTSFGEDGAYSFTFFATKDDEVQFLIDGNSASTDLAIPSLSLTAGAGVYGAIPKSVVDGYSTKSTLTGVSTSPVKLFGFTPGTFETDFRDITILSKDPDAGGGGEIIKLSVATVGGTSTSAVTVTEVSRALVNGVGGTGDDPAPMVITTSLSGKEIEINVESSGALLDIDGRMSGNIRLL